MLSVHLQQRNRIVDEEVYSVEDVILWGGFYLLELKLLKKDIYFTVGYFKIKRGLLQSYESVYKNEEQGEVTVDWVKKSLEEDEKVSRNIIF